MHGLCGQVGRLVGVVGCPWGACSCIRPSLCRSTQSTPSTRSCSSCCGGARSSIACSARSCTASSELCPQPECRLTSAGLHRHLMNFPSPSSLSLEKGATPPAAGLCPRCKSRTCALGDHRDNKAMCVCMCVGLCTGGLSPPDLPSGWGACGGQARLQSQTDLSF